jgi:hypothetical protein
MAHAGKLQKQFTLKPAEMIAFILAKMAMEYPEENPFLKTLKV